jgi:putative ABC transport system permease protein
MAVRVALGADRWRIIRQLLTESVLTALIGAALGVGFAYAFLQWIKANILGGIPFWMQFTIDGPVLLFTTSIAVATGLLFGLVPAIQSARPNLNETLRDGGSRGTSAGRARQRLRSSLVVGEVALSLVLLVGAALLIRSFLGMQNVKPGFDASNLLTMRVTLSGPTYDSIYKRHAFWDRFLTQLNERPGVVSAAITNNIPLRRGRMFTQQEWADSTVTGRVAVINEYMAQKFWKTPDAALGKRFRFGSVTDTSRRWITIIGVAADIRHRSLTSDPDLQGYMPYRQGGWNTAAIVVRTRGEAALMTSTVLSALKQADPLVPAYRILSMDANIERSYWQQALYGKMFGAFATIALVLAAVGVYGVISYAVSQRTQEIGVRVALGAQRTDVLRLVVGHGALLGGIGVAIGLVGALAVTRFLRTLLFGVSPFDPASFVGVSLVLTAIALLASYIPARRAAKVDPVEALRYE